MVYSASSWNTSSMFGESFHIPIKEMDTKMITVPMSSRWSRLKKYVSFGVIGGSIALSSYISLYVMIGLWHWPAFWSYLIQTIIAVELNFVLNNVITFRHQHHDNSLLRLWLKFHAVRILIIPLNQIAFTLLVWAGVPYLLANTICIAGSTLLNFLASDKLVYASRKVCLEKEALQSNLSALRPLPSTLPFVSVIIPVKNSDDTIEETVKSLLVDQDYEGDYEVILVGDKQDLTWSALAEFHGNTRLRLIETEIKSPRRDANAKRQIGLEAARGSVLALTDSDMVLATNWLTMGVELIRQFSVVTGSMISIGRGFWGSYVDANPLGSKTPRMDNAYVLTRENYAHGSNKPPVTANMFFRAEVFETVGGPDPNFVYSYEDYPWFRDMVDNGFEVYCTSLLAGMHYHRHGWRKLSKEYYESGYGCADYVLKFPRCALSLKRLEQMFEFVGVALLLITGLVVWPIETILASITVAVVVSVVSGVKTEQFVALVYPVVTLVLGSFFSIGMFTRLLELKLHLIQPTVTHVLSKSEFIL